MQETILHENTQIKLSEILLSFGRAISITLGMGVFHTLQTAKVAYLIAHNLGLNKKQKEHLVFSALLHDIGVSSIKNTFLNNFDNHETDIFKQKDLDIMKLLNFSKQSNNSEITELIMSHSLEGVQFLKQTEIKKILQKILKKDITNNDVSGISSIDDMAFLSKILYLSDILECAAVVEDNLEDKATAAGILVESLAMQLFDLKTTKTISCFIKTKEFWFNIGNKHLFSDLFLEFEDETYSLFSIQLLEFLNLFAGFIDIKSPHTAQHSTNTAKISRLIAKELNLSEKKCEIIYHAGLIHDVGKLAISNTIIDKPEKLSFAEYSTMKMHPKITKKILKPMTGLNQIITWSVCHHERLDGSGYPNGFNRNQLSTESMIIAVADVYEAMTANRPYRKGLNKYDVLEHINHEGEKLFTNPCIHALENLIRTNSL